jgi:hypothetical protein
MKEKGMSREDLSQVSRELLDGCLSVQRESAGLMELQTRFPSSGQLSTTSRAALNELRTNHLGALQKGLDAEIDRLRAIGFEVSVGTEPKSPGAIGSGGFEERARKNQSLCQELITGAGDDGRSATNIVSDLLDAIERLRGAAKNLESGPQRQ